MVAKIANAVKERAEEELARVREGFESLTLQVSELELSRDDAKRKLMERDNEYLERALRAESELADWKSSGEKMAVRFNEVVAEHAELLAHERETHKCLGEILGTDDSLEQCAIRMKAKAEENARDAERINYFEQRAADGGSPALVNDDNGHWAVVEDGMQSVPEGDGPQTISTSFWIEADQWHDSARAAIDAAMKEKP